MKGPIVEQNSLRFPKRGEIWFSNFESIYYLITKSMTGISPLEGGERICLCCSNSEIMHKPINFSHIKQNPLTSSYDFVFFGETIAQAIEKHVYLRSIKKAKPITSYSPSQDNAEENNHAVRLTL